MPFNAMDENGNAVDWWFMYKVAGKSKTGAGIKVTGTEYVYFDSNAPSDGKLTLSPHHVDQDGALANTLKQVFVPEGSSTQHQGWFFYNDENPITGAVVGSRGHTKGVLAFDMGTNSGFWLVQSVPKFPPAGSYSYPKTGMPNAQTLLCVSLQDASAAQDIARQMFVAQQPNVYLASRVPAELLNTPNDARVKLMQNQVAQGTTAVQSVMPFNSRAGTKFMAIAKNKTWGLDFYNDLVGPTLHEDLEVETWEHDPTPPPLDSDHVHTVVDMKGIDLNPLGINISWPEPDDHAKLAISARSELIHFVCVGDINFTIAQEKRGGGTVAFKCEALWSSLSQVLVGVTTHLKAGSKPAKIAAAFKSKPAPKTKTVAKEPRK